jgi:DNA-binding NarL/FixJ family response regulator
MGAGQQQLSAKERLTDKALNTSAIGAYNKLRLTHQMKTQIAVASPHMRIAKMSKFAEADILLEASQSSEQMIVLVDRRVLSRECLTYALKVVDPGLSILSFSSAAEWVEHRHSILPACVMMLHINQLHGPEFGRELALIKQAVDAPPVVLLLDESDEEDPEDIIGALNSGVQGYIPSSMPLSVAVEAMRLVAAGGTYVPMSSLLTCRCTTETSDQAVADVNGSGFTSRQMAVIKGLREGKTNKTIAYELNMCESTVKVHVGNIMKKLKARSRTEIAFKTRELFAAEDRRRLMLDGH